jgi:hypothetical protein
VEGNPGCGCDVRIFLCKLDQNTSQLWLVRSGTSLWTDIILYIIIAMDIVF